MKALTNLTLTLFFVTAFAAFASAQAGGKVAVINTEAFRDETRGITKYTAAIRSVEAEFAPAIRELETLTSRINTLEKEIKALQGASSAADQQAAQRKVDEYEKLVRDLKFKQEDVKTRYGRRYSAVTAPLNETIGAALTEFAKKNGYAIVLDIARDTAGVIVTIADEKADITRDFIAFFNAKP